MLQIRFIIALLGLDAARRTALLGSIRKLLELAFNSTDEVAFVSLCTSVPSLLTCIRVSGYP